MRKENNLIGVGRIIKDKYGRQNKKVLPLLLKDYDERKMSIRIVDKSYSEGDIFLVRNAVKGKKQWICIGDVRRISSKKDLSGYGFSEDMINRIFETAEKESKNFGMEFESSTVDDATSEKKDSNKTKKKKKTLFDDIKKIKSPEDFIVDKNIWNMLLRNAITKNNTLITGPTGSGKTEIIEKVAESLGYEIVYIDMGSMQDPIPSMLGTHTIKDGQSVFEYSNFAKEIMEKEKKKIVVFDEINRAPFNSNNILFPMLDKRRELNVSVAFNNKEPNIKIGDNITFFSTANIGMEYHGAMEIDRALLDRFIILELNYLSPSDEVKLVVNRTKIDIGKAEYLTSVVGRLRTLFKKEEITNNVSTRHVLQIAELIADGMGIEDSITNIILPLFIEEERKLIKTAIYEG